MAKSPQLCTGVGLHVTTTVAGPLITGCAVRQMLKKFAVKIALSTATVSENYYIFFRLNLASCESLQICASLPTPFFFHLCLHMFCRSASYDGRGSKIDVKDKLLYT